MGKSTNGKIADFNKALLARVLAKHAAGELDPSWEHSPALTHAIQSLPEYIQHTDWMKCTFESMPKDIQKIVAQMAKIEVVAVPEDEYQEAYMTVLLRLLREYAAR
jgi:hypothetical protein